MLPCYKSTKLVLDKILAIGLIVLLLPVCLIVALLVSMDQGTVFFRQERPGLMENPFRLLKFKTMKDGNEEDKMRLTTLGKWLRRYHIDELPQLWNVLRGEMSLIGPRPYLMDYLPLYSDKHRRIHWVLPGLTGWSQVNGGNALKWTEKLDLDVYYVDHISFWLDVRIVFKTVINLLKRGQSNVPATRFLGYSEKIN